MYIAGPAPTSMATVYLYDVCLALRGLEHVAELKVRLSLALLVMIRWQSFLESVDIRLA